MLNAASVNAATAGLQEWMHSVLKRKGQFAADAQLVIDRVFEAEVTHRTVGGLRSFANILTAIDMGDVDPRARTLTVVDAPAIAVLDGSTGIGQVGATRAMQVAVQKAQITGIAMVVVKNSQPEVDVAGIAALASSAGCIGLCASNWGKGSHPTVADGPAWLSAQPHGWAIPHGNRIWTALRTDPMEGAPLPSLTDAFRGVLSLALTAGLTDSKLPSAKKRASPFGAGTEHACLAIHIPSFSATESFTRIGDELAQRGGDGTAGWELRPDGPLPETLALSTELLDILRNAGADARVSFPV